MVPKLEFVLFEQTAKTPMVYRAINEENKFLQKRVKNIGRPKNRRLELLKVSAIKYKNLVQKQKILIRNTAPKIGRSFFHTQKFVAENTQSKINWSTQNSESVKKIHNKNLNITRVRISSSI